MEIDLRCNAVPRAKKYAFRIMVIGPNGVESGWSDEAVCMAP